MPAHSQPDKQYTYLAVDLLTGEVRDEIPFSSVSFSRELNKAGGFSASAPLETARTIHLTGDDAPNKITESNLGPAQTALWVIRDGVPMWGGIIWGFQADLENNEVQFAGQDFWSYYWKRILYTNKSYSASVDDQFSVVEDLLTYAAAQASGDIGTTVSYSALSGVKRDRKYYWHEFPIIGEIIEQLAQVDNGFDFAIDYTGNFTDGFAHQLTLSYPFRGRSTDLVFDTQKNVRLLRWSKDGLSMANRSYAIGAGEGKNIKYQYAVEPSYLDEYPLLEWKSAYKDASRNETLLDHATQDLRGKLFPVETLEVEVLADDPDVSLGSFIVGDTVWCIANKGFINIDGSYRIMSYNVRIDEDGLETVSVSLAAYERTI